jgi:hypothetical protein
VLMTQLDLYGNSSREQYMEIAGGNNAIEGNVVLEIKTNRHIVITDSELQLFRPSFQFMPFPSANRK